MSATVIFGVDFRRKNPKADTGLIANAEAARRCAEEFIGPTSNRIADTAPSEYCAPENDSA